MNKSLVYACAMCAKIKSNPGCESLSNTPSRRDKTAETTVDVLIVGAGAAGLFCAREAAGRGLRVLLLEKGPTPGRKLAISGGGKANFSNRTVTARHYHCHHGQDFSAAALAAFGPDDMLALMRVWNLPVEERGHGQLFLTVPARRLVEALLNDCRQRGCRLLCHTAVEKIRRHDNGFEVEAAGTRWRSAALVLALGSPAWPQAGGNGMGYQLAQSLGHAVISPRPALVPLRLSGEDPTCSALRELAGISLPVRISLAAPPEKKNAAQAEQSWKDDLLFTHEGLSGPAALKASLFWREGAPLWIDFLPDQSFKDFLDVPAAGRQTARALLARHLPQRLVDALLPAPLARRKIAELSRAAREELTASVQARMLTPSGTAGLKKAEACTGGVDIREVAPHSMGSLLCPNLHIIGELLDVTGLLGGYNLHWAWASGMAAGRAVLK